MKKILTALLAGLVAAGSFATVSSAALAQLEELPAQGDFAAEAAYEDGTIVWFSNGGFNDAERAKSLFDQDLQTKWCHAEPWSFVTWEVAEPVSITGYQMITANDNEQYPGRLPISWYFKGCNDYNVETDEGSWEVIDYVEDSVAEGLIDLNWATFTFNDLDMEEVPEFKYFCFEIEVLGSANLMQLSEIAILYEGKGELSVDADALKAEADKKAAQDALDAAVARIADYEAYAAEAATYTYPSSGTAVPDGSVLINGERIGDLLGYGDNATVARWCAFDGNTNSFFDPITQGVSYAGIDAGEEMIITKIMINPRDTFLARFNGATIQASNDPTFATYVDIFVSAEEATEFAFIDCSDKIIAENNTGYRYFRYINSVNPGDVGEVELYGYAKDGSNPEYGTYAVNLTEVYDALEVTKAEAAAAGVEATTTEATETEATEETEAATEETEAATEETEAATEETEAATEETEAVTEETEAATEETEAATEETEEVVDVATPSTDAEETEAPQTFDAAIIAGIAAVVSLAGYAVSKKR